MTEARDPAGRPAFADVAAAELNAVYRYLVNLTRDPVLAEDLASATFERACREWGRYDPGRGRPRVWLIGIARRLTLDHRRADARRTARERRAAAPEAHDGGVGADPGLPAEMRAALARLTDTERELVALRVILDVETTEVARILGTTPGAVSTGLHRALGKLRQALTDTSGAAT